MILIRKRDDFVYYIYFIFTCIFYLPFLSQSVKDQLAELEKIIEDVTKYFPEQKNLVQASRKNLAFKHIDSLLLERHVREWNVLKKFRFWCVVLPFWLLFATFCQLFPIFLRLAFKHIDTLLLERNVREWNVLKRYSFWCVLLPFWLLFATFWQLFPIFYIWHLSISIPCCWNEA